MRHQKKHGMKLGTDASHTKAMKKSLVRALLTNDRIKTTLTRAKAIRPEVDKVVTWAKRGDLHARRLAIAAVGDAELVRETFDKAAQGMWQDRSGGYTRIMKLGTRKGDNAEIAIIELVQEAAPATKKDARSAKSAAKVSKVAKKPAAAADEKPAEEGKNNEAPAEKPKDGENTAEPKQPDSEVAAKDEKSAPEASVKGDSTTVETKQATDDKTASTDAAAAEKTADEKPAEDKKASAEPAKDDKDASAESAQQE